MRPWKRIKKRGVDGAFGNKTDPRAKVLYIGHVPHGRGSHSSTSRLNLSRV